MPVPFPYSIIRTRRASISLQVNRRGEVVVRAPRLVPKPVIDRFVSSKAGWVEKQLAKANKVAAVRPSYENGGTFLYLGKYYKLKFGAFRTIHVDIALNVPVVLKFRAEKEIRDWYVRTAKSYMSERTAVMAKTMNVTHRGIRFSDTSSQWGSCTHDNRLQFSWRLIMAPPLVVDYVIVHELAHTVEKNHSRRFWSVVGKYKPAYRQYVKWLKQNAGLLHAHL